MVESFKTIRWNRLIWFSPALVFAIWLAYPNWVLHQLLPVFLVMDDGSWAVRGQVGDSFGAFNALFSGLGIAGLAVNIYMQNRQIKKLDDKERENEDLLKKQVEAMRLTALLNYYTSEIARIDNDLSRAKAHMDNHKDGADSVKNDPQFQELVQSSMEERKQNIKLRKSIVDMLSRLQSVELD